ncbi:hypothetical protein RHMOL_Rhmol05G0031600 [Rhododendron molle]|uniref:Uncharacterized protein n=1 Tax=Rhododendron molle TaxID=49168 RepID=A0ACC0NLK4_RHOML|nr:hypothetical protein RHMOL_Rhmol05G0031600 [Rhododendron molle]
MSFLNIINPRAHPIALSLMDDLPALPILEVPSLLNSPSLTYIYDLPEELIVNILSRLYSDHLARSRVVSKRFSDISTEVRSVNLLRSLDRYTNSRRLTPFKKIITDLILSMGDVDSISIGVEERAIHKSLEIKLDDLYLTEVSFVYPWLKRVCGGLTSLSISDYRKHSRRKWSGVLSLISFHCKNLHELVLKNAWLSTNGLSSAMLMLTSLTLAYVRPDGENLDKVNSCLPSLQILNLILVEGLKNPQIDLLHLRTCQYVGSSLATTTPLQFQTRCLLDPEPSPDHNH